MAGRSTTITAIFNPGYAAAEQFTSAKLGPWTHVYGLAATFYHAITATIPPSAIERIIKDAYEPLSTLQPEGFPPGLLAGIDAGLAVSVEDRPKTIAEWRHMLRSDGYGTSSQEATSIGRRPDRQRLHVTAAASAPQSAVATPASPAAATPPVRTTAALVSVRAIQGVCNRAGYETLVLTIHPDRIEGADALVVRGVQSQ